MLAGTTLAETDCRQYSGQRSALCRLLTVLIGQVFVVGRLKAVTFISETSNWYAGFGHSPFFPIPWLSPGLCSCILKKTFL